MIVTDIKLDLRALAGEDTVMIIKCVPHYPWSQEDNARSKESQGYDVTGVCPKREFAKFVAHVRDGDYEKLFANGATPIVRFEGFEAYFYKDFRSNDYVLKATADKMIPVTTK